MMRVGLKGLIVQTLVLRLGKKETPSISLIS